MSFTDTFVNSYKQSIEKTVQGSDTEITASEIVSRLAKCIETNFPKSGGEYNETIICKGLLSKKSITEEDLVFVKESINEPMKSLNMTLIDSKQVDYFKLNPLQYSVFPTRGLFEKSDFESVNCFMRVSNFEAV